MIAGHDTTKDPGTEVRIDRMASKRNMPTYRTEAMNGAALLDLDIIIFTKCNGTTGE
jgi:hypothetical protein